MLKKADLRKLPKLGITNKIKSLALSKSKHHNYYGKQYKGLCRYFFRATAANKILKISVFDAEWIRKVAVSESEENQGIPETTEPANTDKQIDSQTITITKSLDLVIKDTRDSAEDLEAAIRDVMVFNEETGLESLQNMMKKMEELTVAFLSNLQSWKTAKEREEN